MERLFGVVLLLGAGVALWWFMSQEPGAAPAPRRRVFDLPTIDDLMAAPPRRDYSLSPEAGGVPIQGAAGTYDLGAIWDTVLQSFPNGPLPGALPVPSLKKGTGLGVTRSFD